MIQPDPPRMVTLAKVLSEDWNPRIKASLFARFGEGELVECPLTVREPSIQNDGQNITVRWKMDNWVPNEDCWVSHLLVYFLDHEDTSLIPLDDQMVAGQVCTPTYSASGTQVRTELNGNTLEF